MSRHVVTADDFENCLEHVRQKVHDNPKIQPSEGIFGAHSETWRSAGDWIGFLASAKIFMMQESHPVIGKALNDHSNVEDNPVGRWKNSFNFVNTITFAPVDIAFEKARQLWKIHSYFQGELLDGTPYAANEEDALLWVAGNMYQAMDEMHDMAYGSRTKEEKKNHYREFKLFASMFGISSDTIPPEYRDFQRYYQDTINSGMLQVQQQTKERFWFFADKFLYGTFRELSPMATKYVSFTSGLLPKTVREQYDMPWGLKDKATFYSLKGVIKTYPVWPATMRENIYYKQHVKGLYK
jgi:uncharacterized protein (DUF2236 family)